MSHLRTLILTFLILFSVKSSVIAQVCIPTYGTVCFSGGGGITYDIVDNFWTVGGVTDITNMDTDCCMLPNNYWYTGLAVTVCPGETIETNVQCQPAAFDQGFAIWIDWNQDDVFALGEKVYASPGFGDEVWTGSFTVPVDAAPGTYNMRVRSSYAEGGTSINPCDMQTWGETEDYLVIVGTCNPTICEGDTVEIDLGTMPPGPITYAWTPAMDISDPFGGPTVDVWPSDTTTYTCTITSPDSTWTVPIEVYVVHPANPFAGLDDTICHDLLVGYPLDGTVETDEATLALDWDKILGPGAAIFLPDDDILNPTASVTAAGLYEFVLKTIDLSGVCPDQRDTVAILYVKESHTLASTDPLCFGSSDGTITVTGTGAAPSVEFSIDGGVTWQVSNVFNDLPAGTYTVTSRNEFGCEFSSDITLVDPTEVVLTVSSDTLICRNGTATISASATGGVSFTYDWSIPGADDGPVQTISPLVTPTIVTVTAYNENGCPSSEGSIEITLRDPITLTISAVDSICPGFESGASVVAVGGDGSYDYSWTANGITNGETGSSFTSNPVNTTTYCVTVNDGCETTPVTICTQTIINPVPAPSFTSDITAGCNPSMVNFETTLLPGDIATWTINGATYTGDAVSYEFTEVGFYDITLHITNQYGCENEITGIDYIEIVDVPYPDFYINPNPTTIFNTEVRLSPSLTGPDYSYEWTMEGGTPSTSTEESPSVIYPGGVPNDYLVTLTVTNSLGCAGSIEHYVNILSDVIIYAPNIFTPDGDQFNEGWRVYIDGIDIYDYHCMVFNRWGELVWESYDATGMWMGTYGSGMAQDGTYVWVVTAKENTSDKKVEFRGAVTIAR